MTFKIILWILFSLYFILLICGIANTSYYVLLDSGVQKELSRRWMWATALFILAAYFQWGRQ